MDTVWQPGYTLETLRALGKHTMVEYLGIELTELGGNYLTGTMPVDHRTCQPMRLLHGGASVVLAETLGTLAAVAANRTPGTTCVGQEINANHIRSVSEGGRVTGTARPFHIGASSHVWGIEIADERARRVCIARITMAVVRANGSMAGAP